MKRINKYLYGYKLYVNYGYGHGWEYEIFEETRKGYLENKKLYLENCPYPQKWARGRKKTLILKTPNKKKGIRHAKEYH